MAKLPNFSPTNERRNRWDLVNDKTDRIVKFFDTKDEATKADALRGAVGADGSSGKIKKENARFQEGSTYPRSADPKS
ncbi:hypothetical protein [Brevundimonas diminuta]|uniref:hypothetical protein n=1 Tax=Brevundimonas diminuta TaxID=293 RepID=UPI003D062215